MSNVIVKKEIVKPIKLTIYIHIYSDFLTYKLYLFSKKNNNNNTKFVRINWLKIALCFSPQDSKSSPTLNRDKNHGCGRDDLTDPEARFNPFVLFFALRFQTASQNPNLPSSFPPWPHTETSISTPRQSSLSRTGSPNRSR